MHIKEKLQKVIFTLLQDGKEVETPVYGLSMFPFLLPGSEVRLAQIDFEDVKRGDVVLFLQNRQLVLHRVIIAGSHSIQTKGDSLKRKDMPINKGEFIAKVIAYKKREKFISVSSFKFHLWAKIMLLGPSFFGYFFHSLSFWWFKIIGQNIVK